MGGTAPRTLENQHLRPPSAKVLILGGRASYGVYYGETTSNYHQFPAKFLALPEYLTCQSTSAERRESTRAFSTGQSDRDARDKGKLLSAFFMSALRCLDEQGTVHVAMKPGHPRGEPRGRLRRGERNRRYRMTPGGETQESCGIQSPGSFFFRKFPAELDAALG